MKEFQNKNKMKVQILFEKVEHGYIEVDVHNEDEITDKANEAITEGTINWLDNDIDIQVKDWEESPISYEQ
jgi:hypothetical protein